jgi:hypothetical protein
MTSADQVQTTSYALAVEQALAMAEQGLTPRQVIEAVAVPWVPREATWDDAVYVLAYAWRKKCAEVRQGPVVLQTWGRPISVDEPVLTAAELGERPRRPTLVAAGDARAIRQKFGQCIGTGVRTLGDPRRPLRRRAAA